MVHNYMRMSSETCICYLLCNIFCIGHIRYIYDLQMISTMIIALGHESNFFKYLKIIKRNIFLICVVFTFSVVVFFPVVITIEQYKIFNIQWNNTYFGLSLHMIEIYLANFLQVYMYTIFLI